MANQVKDIVAILEHHYPPYLASSWDNCGLQLGSYSAPVKSGVALELEPEVVEAAIGSGVDMIITHHPCFSGLEEIGSGYASGKDDI